MTSRKITNIIRLKENMDLTKVGAKGSLIKKMRMFTDRHNVNIYFSKFTMFSIEQFFNSYSLREVPSKIFRVLQYYYIMCVGTRQRP
jgi:hypothetical protein